MPEARDLRGLRFGRLTVTERTEQREKGYILWKCRCDCGHELLVSTRKLVRGTVTNCGCVPKENARRGSVAEDLAGRRFGHLTVLYRTDNKNGRTCWMCRCDCGREKAVLSHDLKAGKCRSCGCSAYAYEHNRVDLTGKRFGRLTAVCATRKRDRRGSVYWHCVCDCGNTAEVTEAGLMHGKCQSCGCLKSENQRKISRQLHMIDGTCVEILEKRKSRRDNTSGFRGVYRLKNDRYRVDIGFKGRRFYIGSYDDFDKAVAARVEAEKLVHEGFVDAYYAWKERAEKDPDWGSEHPLIFNVDKKGGNLSVVKEISI